VINFLKKNSIEDFFKWWYELPIFANFSPPQDILDEKYNIGTNLLAEQFQNLSILKLDPPQFNNSTPIQLILGNLDPLCNEMEDCFKDSLLPIFIHKIEGCGHLTHVQKPQELCDLLQKVIL
jgi:pimeloyl-ACP methyl ester carboxylesterase